MALKFRASAGIAAAAHPRYGSWRHYYYSGAQIFHLQSNAPAGGANYYGDAHPRATKSHLLFGRFNK